MRNAVDSHNSSDLRLTKLTKRRLVESNVMKQDRRSLKDMRRKSNLSFYDSEIVTII